MPQQISCKVLRHVLHIAIYRSSTYHYMGVSIDEGRQNPIKMDDLGLLPFMETPIWISVAIMKVLIMGDHTPVDQNLMLYTAYHILGKWISIIFS